jgi:hypothetical protein
MDLRYLDHGLKVADRADDELGGHAYGGHTIQRLLPLY